MTSVPPRCAEPGSPSRTALARRELRTRATTAPAHGAAELERLRRVLVGHHDDERGGLHAGGAPDRLRPRRERPERPFAGERLAHELAPLHGARGRPSPRTGSRTARSGRARGGRASAAGRGRRHPSRRRATRCRRCPASRAHGRSPPRRARRRGCAGCRGARAARASGSYGSGTSTPRPTHSRMRARYSSRVSPPGCPYERASGRESRRTARGGGRPRLAGRRGDGAAHVRGRTPPWPRACRRATTPAAPRGIAPGPRPCRGGRCAGPDGTRAAAPRHPRRRARRAPRRGNRRADCRPWARFRCATSRIPPAAR